MTLFPPKMIRLRFVIGLALVLVFGGIPEGNEGFQCYTCDGSFICYSDSESNKKDCGGVDEGACVTSGLPASKKRGCYSKAKADCILSAVNGSNCYDPSETNDHVQKVLRKCLEEKAVEPAPAPLPQGPGETCVCTEDSCNKFPPDKDKDEDDDDDGGKDKGVVVKCEICPVTPRGECESPRLGPCNPGEYCSSWIYTSADSDSILAHTDCTSGIIGKCEAEKGEGQGGCVEGADIDYCLSKNPTDPRQLAEGRRTIDFERTKICACNTDGCNSHAGGSTSNRLFIFIFASLVVVMSGSGTFAM